MNEVCLLVDLDKAGLQESWQEKIQGLYLPMEVAYCDGQQVQQMMENGDVVAMLIFSQDPGPGVFEILEIFKKNVGAIAPFQGIVCDDPSPFFLTEVFDWGIERFFTQENWQVMLPQMLAEVNSSLLEEDGSESKIIQLNRSIVSGDQNRIKQAEQDIEESSQYDHLAAYSRGTVLQATGRFNEAVDAFKASQNMNQLFRPSATGIGESLLVLGKVDEAIEIFEELEKLNKRNVDRKANLSNAYLEKGDLVKAKSFLKEAHALSPKHPRIRETKANFYLQQGKFNEAFALMDKLQDVGPFFAAKLNEIGIRLSQKGKGKSALALYKKAHKIVRRELKHKISLNAALACYRLEDYPLCLKYLARCEKECGQKLEKVEKIRKSIRAKERLRTG